MFTMRICMSEARKRIYNFICRQQQHTHMNRSAKNIVRSGALWVPLGSVPSDGDVEIKVANVEG